MKYAKMELEYVVNQRRSLMKEITVKIYPSTLNPVVVIGVQARLRK